MGAIVYFGWRMWQFLVVKIYLCQLILFFVISFFFLDDAWKLTIVGGLFFFFFSLSYTKKCTMVIIVLGVSNSVL
jgi:hypothetical protein